MVAGIGKGQIEISGKHLQGGIDRPHELDVGSERESRKMLRCSDGMTDGLAP